MEDLLKQLGDLSATIDEKISKGVEEVKNASADEAKKVGTDTMTEVKGLVSEWKEKQDAHDAELQKQIDELATNANRQYSGAEIEKTFADKVSETMKSEGYEALKNGSARSFSEEYDISLKAVGDMGSSANLTGEVVAPERRGVREAVSRRTHIRDLMIVTPTISDTIRFVKETTSEGGPAMVAEGGTFPQLDFDLAVADAPVRKIATYLRIPEEMLADIPFLSSFVSRRGSKKLMEVEDNQLLYGDGTGQNLTGVTVNATAIGTFAAVASPQNWDVLRVVIQQITSAHYNPSAILLNPVDVAEMELEKDSQGRYLLPNIYLGESAGVKGLPIIEHVAVTAGQYIVGDFIDGAEIADRQKLAVEFWRQDQDNRLKDLVTVTLKERLALPIYYDGAFASDTFADGITEITT